MPQAAGAPTWIFSPVVDIDGLRAEFPALSRLAYMNAGTDGPLASSAVEAASRELGLELADGRSMAHFERTAELKAALRDGYASLLGCDSSHLALTTCTTEGMAQVIGGLDLRDGDEILTSDEEHPGLLGALVAAREIRGARIREVPLAQIAREAGPRTRLIACSHVGWMSGTLAPAELSGSDIPVLLDGAQGVGAVPVDVLALGCAAYSGAGQKWLCGPDGTGMLYVSPALQERLRVERRGYANLADPGAGLAATLHPDARSLDTLSLNRETLALALGALEVLAGAGWPQVHARAASLAARLAEMLSAAGREVAPRGATTLVSFTSQDPPAERESLSRAGVILRNIPERPWLRASVGAWNDEGDLERLVAALA